MNLFCMFGTQQPDQSWFITMVRVVPSMVGVVPSMVVGTQFSVCRPSACCISSLGCFVTPPNNAYP